MSFAIIAQPLLSVYKGHVGAGQVDPLPSPARLHAALVCAAAQGVRAVTAGDGLQPCDADRAALLWLEENPPDGVAVPETLGRNSAATAYRKEGLIVKEGRNPLAEKLAGKPAVSGVSVSGWFAWCWQQAPPEPVVTALSELCPEVPYLGTSESPVLLSVGETEPTHLLDRQADLFTGDGLDLTVAVEGRLQALETAHAGAARAPSLSRDAYSSSEKVAAAAVVTSGLSLGRYTRPQQPPPPTPWTSVLLFQMSRSSPVPAESRVRFAVAAHRALVAKIGEGAPGILTGAYEPGVPRPANRCAIHFLGPDTPHIGGCAMAVLLPAGADEVDLTLIRMAAQQLTQVRVASGPFSLKAPVEIPADEFWPEPAPGTERWWQTDPVAVPDTRPPRGGSWSLADAIALSAALVWRDEFPAEGRGDTRYRALAAAAGQRIRVGSASRLLGGDHGRYVHKVHPDTLIQPYRAVLHLGSLAGSRTIIALGQSRHLGGGLLVPRDLPAAIARRLGR